MNPFNPQPDRLSSAGLFAGRVGKEPSSGVVGQMESFTGTFDECNGKRYELRDAGVKVITITPLGKSPDEDWKVEWPVARSKEAAA